MARTFFPTQQKCHTHIHSTMQKMGATYRGPGWKPIPGEWKRVYV